MIAAIRREDFSLKGENNEILFALNDLGKTHSVIFSEKAKERIREFLSPFVKREVFSESGFGFHLPGVDSVAWDWFFPPYEGACFNARFEEERKEVVVGYTGLFFKKPVKEMKRSTIMVFETTRSGRNHTYFVPLGRKKVYLQYFLKLESTPEGFGLYVRPAGVSVADADDEIGVIIHDHLAPPEGEGIDLMERSFREVTGLEVGRNLLGLVKIEWGRDIMVVLPEEVEEINRRGYVVLSE